MISVSLRPGHNRGSHLSERPDYMIVNWHVSSQSHIWRPPTDLMELDHCFLVRVEIAGMLEENFNISLDQNLLVIQGSRPDISELRAYHQMEINFGEFITSVDVPGSIEPDKVTAEYKSGFLWVNLPKAPTRHISINE
jgi:HSP20 family protein